MPDESTAYAVTCAEAPCSREGALGGCQITAADGAPLTSWYYQDPQGDRSVDDVRAMCTAIHTTYVEP